MKKYQVEELEVTLNHDDRTSIIKNGWVYRPYFDTLEEAQKAFREDIDSKLWEFDDRQDIAFNLNEFEVTYDEDGDIEDEEYIDCVETYDWFSYQDEVKAEYESESTEELVRITESTASFKSDLAEDILKSRLSDDWELALDIKERAKAFNMRVICERADVSYGTWRLFNSGKQRMPGWQLREIEEAMDEA